MDKFIHIMQENNLRLEEIDHVKAVVTKTCASRNPEEMTTEDDFSWNAPYLIACAAYGINVNQWHKTEVLKDPKILAFMRKVTHEITEAGEMVGYANKDLLMFSVTGAEVITKKGASFRIIGNCKDGVCEIKRMTDKEIVEKFINNVSEVLPTGRVEEVVQTMLELEKLKDTAELIKMVTP